MHAQLGHIMDKGYKKTKNPLLPLLKSQQEQKQKLHMPPKLNTT